MANENRRFVYLYDIRRVSRNVLGIAYHDNICLNFYNASRAGRAEEGVKMKPLWKYSSNVPENVVDFVKAGKLGSYAVVVDMSSLRSEWSVERDRLATKLWGILMDINHSKDIRYEDGGLKLFMYDSIKAAKAVTDSIARKLKLRVILNDKGDNIWVGKFGGYEVLMRIEQRQPEEKKVDDSKDPKAVKDYIEFVIDQFNEIESHSEYDFSSTKESDVRRRLSSKSSIGAVTKEMAKIHSEDAKRSEGTDSEYSGYTYNDFLEMWENTEGEFLEMEGQND